MHSRVLGLHHVLHEIEQMRLEEPDVGTVEQACAGCSHQT